MIMKILHIMFSVGWGGLEKYAIDQAVGMRERGHEVSFIRRANTETAKALFAMDFPGQEWAPLPYVDIMAMVRIRRAANEMGAGIIHAHHSADLGLIFPAMIGLKQIKFIFSTYMRIPRPKKDLYHRMEYGAVQRVLTLSDQMTENAQRNLPVAPHRIMTMPYGIRIENFDSSSIPKGEIRDKYQVPKDAPLIGIIGRLDPLKGQMEMIRAMPAIHAKFPNAVLALVGGETPELVGTYKPRLEKEVESLGLGKSVIFTGYSTNPALPLADLDVYVIPTDNETFGMSAIEAMAMEAPVVGADNGGLPEVLDHGACGLLANPRDPASLAQAVIRYLSDEDLRKTMSRKGREKAQRLYDRVKSMDRLEKIYQDTLSES